MNEAAAASSTGLAGRLRRSSIPLRIISLSGVLLGALIVSAVVMTLDLLATERRIERANERFHMLEVAADAHHHFGEMRYWLTDLSVSLLTLSERRAGTARNALNDDLATIETFAPDAAAEIRNGAAAYFERALEAADAYTEEKRVIGNSMLAAARVHSDAVDAALERLTSALEAEADAARDRARAAARQAMLRATVAVAAIVLAGGLMTFVVLRSIIRPLAQLDRSMAELTAGRLDARMPAEGEDELGRMARTLRLFRDSQAERRRLEAAAERQRETIRTAIETIPDGFALYDGEQRLVLVNHRYLEIFPEVADLATPGRPFEEIMRAQVERGTVETGGMDAEAWIAERVRRHGSPDGLVEQRLSGGASIRIAKRKTPDGGTVAVYTDITDLIRRQDELEEARAGAEAANEAKSRFLASMSHELRTPLNAIIGYSEMLMEDAEDLEEEHFAADLEKIMVSGRHLLALINDVLDLSKIEAGKMELFVEPIALEPLLSDVETTIRPLVDKNGNRLVIDADLGGDDRIEADKTKLRQNLFNLLSNAAKFTENGTITLSVRRRTDQAGDWIDFAVADTGIGMSEAAQAKLFEAFVQADGSTTRNYGGTGLGLAITRAFVEMMGGTISVESARGEGSTFRFSIPAVHSADAQPARSRQHGAALVNGDERGIVLVIDDDPRARHGMCKALHDAGFAVEEASSGAAGLERARARRPDAIVLDVIMPEQDGWSVLQEIKGDQRLCDIPVVLATVVTDREMGLAFGAIDHLTKPIESDRLVSVIEGLWGGGERDVLVVDDDPATRTFCRRVLTRQGWSVREAPDGARGLEQLDRQRPALMLLDLMMPEKDGFQVLEEMQARPALAGLPVIVITSKDLSREEIEWLQARTTEVVRKGLTGRSDLVAALRRLVSRSETA